MTLQVELRDYVNRTHANAWLRANGMPPDEPALVSSFLSKEMYRGLRAILQKYATPGTHALVRGIFTHQTPKVRLLSQSKSVEIADIMFVHQHFSSGNRRTASATSGRALLFQAKRTGTPSTGSLASGTQAIQFELYRDWSEFVGSTRLMASPIGYPSWDFLQGGAVMRSDATAGAQYLTVFDQNAFSMTTHYPQWAAPLRRGPAHSVLLQKFGEECAWFAGTSPDPAAIPRNGVDCFDDFGTAFGDFLSGVRGRPFQPGLLRGPDHWSIFVNTMLNLSAKPNGDYLYTSTNQGVASGMRGRNFLTLQTIPALWHAIREEVDCFVSNEVGDDESPFEITNSLLECIGEDQKNAPDGVPPDGSAQGPTEEQGGHVPMLLVTTVGDHESPFRSNTSIRDYPHQ